MMIKVDIPEPFIDGDNTMVNITSDSFCYSSIDSRYEGFQSSYKDGNMNQKIQGKLEIIADQFKEIQWNIKIDFWGTIALWQRYEYNKNDQLIFVWLYIGKEDGK